MQLRLLGLRTGTAPAPALRAVVPGHTRRGAPSGAEARNRSSVIVARTYRTPGVN
jgi:hypothetical protein